MKYQKIAALTALILIFMNGCGGGGGGGSDVNATSNITIKCPNDTSKTAATQDAAYSLCDAPKLQTVFPTNSANDVNVDTFAGVTVTTDSALDAKSITSDNIKLSIANSNVTGVVTTVGTNGFKFTPSSKLNYVQTYAFTATVKDTLGKMFTINISFLTKPIVCSNMQLINSAGNACRMPIYKTSYENKNSIIFNQTQIPSVRSLNIPKVYSDEQDSNERSVTFGDFFQEGKYSVFVSSNRASNLYGIPNINDIPGVGYFLSKDANDNWKDRTNELLKSFDDRRTCVTTSYSITADFNNDGKPDVYIACNGVDYDIRFLGFSLAELLNRWASNQIIFLSKSDGTYKRIEVPFQIYGHQAAAADINGDGNVDIITINALGGDYDNSVERISILLGNGDGTFTQDKSIIPKTAELADLNGMWNINLIPIDSRLDLVLAQDLFTIWIKGDKNGGFDWTTMKKFILPISVFKGTRYGTPIDVVYDDGYFYFYSTSQWDPAGVEWAIIKYSVDTVNSKIIYTFDNPTISMKPYSGQFKPTILGNFVAYSGGCSTNAGGCAMNVKYK